MAKNKSKRKPREPRAAGELRRASVVMSSQASSAAGGEPKMRQKLAESGDVAVMIAIREDIQAAPSTPYTGVPGNAITFARSSPLKRAGGPYV